MDNDEIIGKYLSSLQDQYAHLNTGGAQLAGTENIGKLVNPVQDENKGTSLVTPARSGEQVASHTENIEGALNTDGSITETPIAEQNTADLAYLFEDIKYVPGPKDVIGGLRTPMDLSDSKAQYFFNKSIQLGEQR